MAQSLKTIKLRIRSIENTKKLTRAMEMISVSKLRRMENMRNVSMPYSSKIESLLKNILSLETGFNHPLLEKRPDTGKIVLCLVTSDTGLCSAYNHAVIRAAENFLRSYTPDNVILVTIGKKGFSYFKKRNFRIPYSYIGLNGRFSNQVAEKVIADLEKLFLSKEANQVYIAYTRIDANFRSVAVLEKILNIEFEKKEKIDYIFEPGMARVLEELIPAYLSCKVKMILLNAFTAEHKARAVAMGEATKNARELLEGLILLRNKLRQSNITREIIEVISSAEALRG